MSTFTSVTYRQPQLGGSLGAILAKLIRGGAQTASRAGQYIKRASVPIRAQAARVPVRQIANRVKRSAVGRVAIRGGRIAKRGASRAKSAAVKAKERLAKLKAKKWSEMTKAEKAMYIAAKAGKYAKDGAITAGTSAILASALTAGGNGSITDHGAADSGLVMMDNELRGRPSNPRSTINRVNRNLNYDMYNPWGNAGGNLVYRQAFGTGMRRRGKGRRKKCKTKKKKKKRKTSRRRRNIRDIFS